MLATGQCYCVFLEFASAALLQRVRSGGLTGFLKLSYAIFALICVSCQFSRKLWILKITKHTKAMLSFLQRRAFFPKMKLDFSASFKADYIPSSQPNAFCVARDDYLWIRLKQGIRAALRMLPTRIPGFQPQMSEVALLPAGWARRAPSARGPTQRSPRGGIPRYRLLRRAPRPAAWRDRTYPRTQPPLNCLQTAQTLFRLPSRWVHIFLPVRNVEGALAPRG